MVLSAMKYRAKNNRLSYYRPYPKQLEFHAAGKVFRERLFSAGNQLGKTLAGSFEAAMHLTGRYPEWWEGREFSKPTVGYAASETSELTRDGVQRLLFGRPGLESEFGTGSIPRDAIKETSPRPGTPNAYSQAVIRHGGGGDVQSGESAILFRSYDQGREKFQADTLDWFWFDEEPPEDVYSEGLTRTNKVLGPVWLTATPLKGMSSVQRRFHIEHAPGTVVILMGVYDAKHYSKEHAEQIIASYPAHERDARAFGKPILGSGAVYPIEEARIKVEPFEIPSHWLHICGLDIGWDHPTAAVWAAICPDPFCFYVYDAYRVSKAPVVVHAAVLRDRGSWIPVAWPHDALQTQKDTGVPMRDAYRNEGVNMLPERVQFEDGSYGIEPGVQDIYNAMVKNQFKVFLHLNLWLEEYRIYHRKDGKIVAEYDDLMSATRYAWMARRFGVANRVQKLNIYRSSWRA